MALFSKPKVVLWPKDNSLDVYLDQSENNFFSFESNLWQAQSEESLKNLSRFFQQNKINEVSVLLNDSEVVTKTFIYDSVVKELAPEEVVSLAKDSTNFSISPEAVTFDLEPDGDRTLVRTRIFNQGKFSTLNQNLQNLGLKVTDFETVSASLLKVFHQVNPGSYFLFYPHGNLDYLALLARDGQVYLTSFIKKNLPELKKLLNYAQAYFKEKDPRQFFPSTDYSESEISSRFGKAGNLPLPVLAFFIGNAAPKAVIITPVPNQTITDSITPTQSIPMENTKKNILPIIAVFVFVLIATSLIVWFFLNRNKGEVTTPGGEESQPTPTVEVTQAPSPTVAEISKDIKIQVLNGTDISGQAATVKSELSKLGFTNVAAGNSTTAATANKISTKSTIPADYFTKNLTGFTDATTAELPATSSYDVVILIGTNLKTGEAAATATPSPKASPTVKTSTPSASPTVSR